MTCAIDFRNKKKYPRSTFRDIPLRVNAVHFGGWRRYAQRWKMVFKVEVHVAPALMGLRERAMHQMKGQDLNFQNLFDFCDFDHFRQSYTPKRARRWDFAEMGHRRIGGLRRKISIPPKNRGGGPNRFKIKLGLPLGIPKPPWKFEIDRMGTSRDMADRSFF